MRILILEDDPGVWKPLKAMFEENCFTVDVEENKERGFWMSKTNDYDLLIFSHVPEKRCGITLCKEIRSSGKNFPIIILAGDITVDLRVEMLNVGADDCLSRPFCPAEVLAKTRAILRRPQTWQPEVMVLEDLMIDLQKQYVHRGKKDIYLTRKEFQLLEFLLRNVGRVVSRSKILEHVWDIDADPFSNTIETHILKLRQKIDKGHEQKLIHTMPGRGYKVDLCR